MDTDILNRGYNWVDTQLSNLDGLLDPTHGPRVKNLYFKTD